MFESLFHPYLCRFPNDVKHFRVQWDGQHFCFGPGKFRDVKTLLDNFDQQPWIRNDEGVLFICTIRGCVRHMQEFLYTSDINQ